MRHKCWQCYNSLNVKFTDISKVLLNYCFQVTLCTEDLPICYWVQILLWKEYKALISRVIVSFTVDLCTFISAGITLYIIVYMIQSTQCFGQILDVHSTTQPRASLWHRYLSVCVQLKAVLWDHLSSVATPRTQINNQVGYHTAL